MLLLSARQFNLAEAAFNAAAIGDLHTARDQALKRNYETLLWWFANSTNATWSSDDHTKSEAALRKLKREQVQLADSQEIRDYLAEMRAWIGLAAARQATSANRARERLVDALDVYAHNFTQAELDQLAALTEQPSDPRTLTPDLRRRLRAKAILDVARTFNKEINLGAHPQNPVFDRIINR